MELIAGKYDVTCANGPAMNICRPVKTDRFSGEKEFFCSIETRLSYRGSTDLVFDLFMQYEGIGAFFCVICLASLILYFVSSSAGMEMAANFESREGWLREGL